MNWIRNLKRYWVKILWIELLFKVQEMWISFHSYKGGTGKTNISGNLACYLVSKGYKVGLVDTDFSGPGIHALFSLKTKKTLVDYVQNKAALEDIVHKRE